MLQFKKEIQTLINTPISYDVIGELKIFEGIQILQPQCIHLPQESIEDWKQNIVAISFDESLFGLDAESKELAPFYDLIEKYGYDYDWYNSIELHVFKSLAF